MILDIDIDIDISAYYHKEISDVKISKVITGKTMLPLSTRWLVVAYVLCLYQYIPQNKNRNCWAIHYLKSVQSPVSSLYGPQVCK